MGKTLRWNNGDTDDMAQQVLKVLGGDYSVEQYTMTRGTDAQAVLTGANGKRVVLSDTSKGLVAEVSTDKESELMAALKASVEQANKGGGAKRKAKKKAKAHR